MVTVTSIGIGIEITQNIVPGIGSGQGLNGLAKDIETACSGSLGNKKSVSGGIRLSEDQKIEFEGNVVNMTEDGSTLSTKRVKCAVDDSGITSFSGEERFDYTIESRYSDTGVTYKVFE